MSKKLKLAAIVVVTALLSSACFMALRKEHDCSGHNGRGPLVEGGCFAYDSHGPFYSLKDARKRQAFLTLEDRCDHPGPVVANLQKGDKTIMWGVYCSPKK